MPAEWAPQSAILLTWPHSGTDWKDSLDTVEPVFLAIARATLRFQHVIIACEDKTRSAALEQSLNEWATDGKHPGRVRSLQIPADDTWARDHGPITVTKNNQVQLLDFRFNAWGGKFEHLKDNAINHHLSRQNVFGETPMQSIDFVLEGGSIESDGEGTLLTTSECLLTTTRNPDYDRAQVEKTLGELLGAERVLWLNHGYLAGDDTDTHIDTLARFCSADTICYVRCDDLQDEHYPALNAMKNELQQLRRLNGEPYHLVSLPWPDAIYGEGGERLPATYANFLIINSAVLIPVYGVPQDKDAEMLLGQLFPERQIIAIDCRPLIEQHGSLHCVTMQLAKGAVTL